MMRNVVVTGITGTLGHAIARAILADGGYSVIGIGRQTVTAIHDLRSAHPGLVSYVQADLSQPGEIESLYLDTLKPMGPLWGLVNNAAEAYDDLLSNARLERLERMFRVNVLAPVMLTKCVVRDMLLHHTEGSLVHISSVSTRIGYKGLSMYAATKGAMEAFSLGVAREWGSRGIRSNCVAAGFMDTNMTGGLSEEQRQRIFTRTSLKRETSAESVAATVRFLLSDESRSMTGTVVRVDSGS